MADLGFRAFTYDHHDHQAHDRVAPTMPRPASAS
jgi:hypothetical protein